MGLRAVLLVIKRFKGCIKSRSWYKSTFCMPKRLRSTRMIGSAGM